MTKPARRYAETQDTADFRAPVDLQLRQEAEQDIDDYVDLFEIVAEQGQLLALQEWESGGPGVHAHVVELYEYKGTYYVIHDAGVDEYDDPQEALKRSGITTITEATTSISISPELLEGRNAALTKTNSGA